MLDLSHVADVNDDGLLRRRWLNKRKNATRRGLICLLTFEQYAQLFRDAGILSSHVGRSGYHLARYGDKGPYAVGNCRFITAKENRTEMAPPDPVAQSRAQLRRFANSSGTFLGKKHRESTKAAIGAANKLSQAGNRNSQFGRKWITNGVLDKKINADELEFFLSAGWSNGRVPSCNIRKEIGSVAQQDERHATNVEDADSTSAGAAN